MNGTLAYSFAKLIKHLKNNASEDENIVIGTVE